MAEDDGDSVSMTVAKRVQEYYSPVDSGKQRDSRDACFAANVSGDSGRNTSLGLNGGISDSLEDTPKLDFNLNLEVQDSCPGIRAIIHRYQCRKKRRREQEDLNLEEKIITPEEGSKMQNGARFSGLKVYKRIFECLKNSRKVGPNFPGIFKKKRTKKQKSAITPEKGSKMQNGAIFSGLKVYERIFRRNECLKNSRKVGPNFPGIFKKKRTKKQKSAIFHNFFCVEKLNPCIRHNVTSKERSKYYRSAERIIRGALSMKLADETHQEKVTANELSSNFSMKEYKLRAILPSQRQIREAIADPKSFNCVWSLSPMTNFRKKRSSTRRSTKLWGMQEKMKHGCTFSLTWSIQYKRKRLNLSSRNHYLSSLCGVPYLDARGLTKTQIFTGQHLYRKHMFSNLNADDVQGMTDCISQMFQRLCISDVHYQLVVREFSAVDSRKERDNCDRIFGNLRVSDTCFANVTADSGCNTSFGLNGGISEKTTSKEKGKYHTSVEKITRRVLLMKLDDGRHQKRVMDNKVFSNFSMNEHNLSVILPSRRQIMEAMADPKSFNCVWSLCPMTNFRKKRSQTRSRKAQFPGMHEEMKHLEPQGHTFSLTWSVQHKKKRSNVSARSYDLSNLCLVPKAFPLKAISVVTQDTGKENVEDFADFGQAHSYLNAYSLIETPIVARRHLDHKHMFSNLTADEGMTDFIDQMFEKLCVSDVNNKFAERQKLLTKVDLDIETSKAWKMLMETDGCEEI